MKPQVCIIGGGLAGLYAALLLEEAGVEYFLIEARERFGGRLLTQYGQSSVQVGSGPKLHDVGSFDLGATWYWPQIQPDLYRFAEAMNLHSFSQHEEGELLFEESRAGSIHRVSGFTNAPPSSRLKGGMAALVGAVHTRLRADGLLLGCRVRAVTALSSGLQIDATDLNDDDVSWTAERVLLAVPPRLAQATIRFAPQLPRSVETNWSGTATWMAPHAKYLAVYPEPFWRAQGLRGAARSHAGPLAEIHDASSPGAGGALFGFVGIPAAHRTQLPEEALRELCRAQLARLFGPKASSPSAEWLKDWSKDPLTATPADLRAEGHNGSGATQIPAHLAPWSGRVIGIASEWSAEYPGYVAGALDAAQRGVAEVRKTIRR